MGCVVLFADRTDAGRQLAAAVRAELGVDRRDVVVVGLPRGGVPVAFEVARELDAPLDVIVVRKIGVPFRRELAMGAIGEDGVRVISEAVMREAGVDDAAFAAVETTERAELERRVRALRGDLPPVSLDGRTVVVVDDGVATGATARAACEVARARGAARVVLAAPVGPPDVAERFSDVADAVVCPRTPGGFRAIGGYYRDFAQLSDRDVLRALHALPR